MSCAEHIERKYAHVNPLDIALSPAVQEIVSDIYELLEMIEDLEKERDRTCLQKK